MYQDRIARAAEDQSQNFPVGMSYFREANDLIHSQLLSAADRLGRRSIGPQALLAVVATVFIATQLALILRLPLPSYLPWTIIATAAIPRPSPALTQLGMRGPCGEDPR